MTTVAPQSLAELCDFTDRQRDWRVDLVSCELGGGKLHSDAFTALDRQPRATAVMVSGLDQDGLAALVETHGARLRAIHFWKCPRLADLTLLEQLPGLEFAAFYWNQRATRLWDFRRTPRLRGLAFDDFSRLDDLADLHLAASLEELQFGNAVWSKAEFATLEPLTALGRLRRLAFNAKRIVDGRIQPLARLTQLERLDFPPNQFTTEQIAWLRARLPDSVQGRSLGALCRVGAAFAEAGLAIGDVVPVGRRQRCLDSQKDEARVLRQVAKFEAMVREFREHPDREPA